ncbi:signal transduction histidine kinase/ketosteroid isomerase-like protein/flagellar hook-basal body complex protein FliE [Algoriphagus iocasae]|jgi:signal transduction histidine kinase/ketosteroid isomerase-like protein|uniref:histidine kinase n=1 Tax=Algoriphagus iocasae TaxID=1836499 RepID=A0A841MIH2_9BACT|nr:ATP-binding protein [Algoriphagus iocasae]MBB6326683.1 signal transduction histidine kinase/ketosteroid isomerase-like protein/flagellar hook-basal body complex protein FliE [Algoriphagus iocasae]
MKITKALKTELANWLETYWTTYIKGDYELWATFVTDDYYNIGGTKEEIWHSKQEILEYSYALQDQMVGQAEFRNREIEVLPYGDYVMVNEFTDLYVKIEGEWTFYAPFRMSSLLSKTDTGWIALHQHGSYPDMKASEGEAFAADALKAENKRLQEAVDQRTSELLLKNRELEIEAALEKVRTAAMGMNTPNDMLQVCRVIAQQLEVIGLDQIRNVQTAIIESQAEIYLCYQYFPSYDRDIIERTEYKKNPVEQQMVNQMLAAKDSHFLGELTGKELQEFISHRKQENHFKDPLLEESDNLGYCFLSIGEGGLGLTLYKSLDEQSLTIFKRFHQVFSLSYQRFRDIQKAENQAREAQIEAALERLRSRSLVMQKSEELAEASILLEEEVRKLGIENWGCAFHIYDEETTSGKAWDLEWFTSSAGFLPFYKTPRENIFLKYYEESKKGKPLYIQEFGPEVIKQHYDYLKTLPVLGEALTELHNSGVPLPESQIDHVAFFNHGHLLFITYKPIPEAHDIFIRFAKVFNQAYTRFLDLQKAEAQAKEARIESALERIRGQVASMRESTELLEIMVSMRKEFVDLGNEAHYFWHMRWHPDSYEKAMTSGDGTQIGMVMSLPRRIHGDIKAVADWEKGTDPLFVLAMDAEVAVDYVHKMITWGDFEQVDPHAPTLDDIRHIGGLTFVMARTTHGEIGYSLPGSVPNPPQDAMDTLARFAKVFDLAYKRFEDLKNAEYRTKETEIELALERVRSRSMGMQKSDELQEVIKLVYQQLIQLKINLDHAGFVVDYSPKGDWHFWIADEQNIPSKITHPYFESIWATQFNEAKENRTDFFVTNLDFEEKNKFYKELLSHVPGLPEEVKAFYFSCPGLAITTALSADVSLYIENFSGIPYTEAENKIVMRFGKVFQQTYTRFLDLQKAEAQAREAQIEAALERVRSRTLGMQKAEELGDVATVLFGELNTLVENLWTCGFVLCEKDSKEDEWWLSLDNGLIQPFSLPNEGDFAHKTLYEGWEKGESYRTVTLENKQLQEHYEWLMNLPVAKQIFEEMEDSGIPRPKWQRLHAAYFKTGYLVIITEVPCAEEDIFKRFAQVFDLTYTRFLDLTKAEAQAKEAKLELSLQRIRAQVTSMTHSDELFDIVVSMRKEFISLGNEADYFWHMKWTPSNYEMSMTSEDGERVGMIISVPKFVHDEIPRLAKWEKSDSPIIALDLNGPEAWNYLDKMNTYSKYEQADPHAPSEEDILAIGGLTFVIARTTHGEIGFSLAGQVPNPPQESTDTLIRFAGVFDLAYRRFEDLLTAEKQNRKAKIELALERVRARALAMQEPEELIEVAQVMREEMGLVGVEELETSSIYINKTNEGLAECWYSIKDIRDGTKTYVADHFDLNYQDTWVGREMLDFYQSEETKTSIVMKGENRKEWINYCAKQSPKLNGYYGIEIPERTYHLTKFSNGAIGAATPGEISAESWDLLARASLVFSLAYSRFKDLSQAREDLKKLKKAKARAEKALQELKAAQEQLVQQEKLASLGQLTAGIAHEIKNPLNFVNNFSDLSRELIEEVFEELENLESSETKEEIIAILEDVKSNLAKVHEHGTRADGIVKSMLQHSRASNNKMESKAINPIIKEFVNLAFHGMRAAKNPINVTIDLQLKEEVGELKIISEDFSRVILNLCNNAFDAMRDKMNVLGSGNYEAKLTVNTYLSNGKVMLEFIDNGPGIPEEILGKILQPFFTTKKGTEGTGLGLSITHDIIKAHGGSLLVTSKVNEGSKMTIVLPFDPK